MFYFFSGSVIFGLAVLGAFIYSTIWNWLAPPLFGLPEASMLQTYVVLFAVSSVFYSVSRGKDLKEKIKEIIIDSSAKMMSALLIAFVIKTFFL